MAMRLKASPIVLAGCLLALGVATAATQAPAEPPKAVVAAAEPATPAALEVGACQACHDTALSKPFLKSYHAGLEKSCASCHAGAAEHSEAMQAGKDNVPTPSITKLKAD